MNNELVAIQRECKRRQNELAHKIDACTRESAAIDNKGWCNLHLPEIAHQYKSKTDEYWRIYQLWFGTMPEKPTEREIDDQLREGRLYKFGQFAFLLVETIAAAVLAAIFFYAPRIMAVMIGVVIALLLGAAASAVATRWVRREAATQPTKQLERIGGLLVMGLLWLIACVTALAVLRSQGTAVGDSLFLITTTMITLLSPLCSGLCSYAADLLLWSKRLCADMRWLRALARDLDQLLATSERSIPPGPGSGAPPNPASLMLKAIGSSAAAIFAVAALFGAPVVSSAADVPIYLYPDVSGSARAGEIVRVLKDFSSRLSNYEGSETLVVTIIPFFEQAFAAAPLVTVSIPGTSPVNCQEAEVASELARISRSYAETAKNDGARQCAGLRSSAREEATRQRAIAIAKLDEAVDSLSGLKLQGRCTAVNAIIRRAIRESPKGISVVVSDLENSCASQELPKNLREENQLFLIPVSSRDHPIETEFDGIQARFSHMVPWVQVIEPFRLEEILHAIIQREPNLAGDR